MSTTLSYNNERRLVGHRRNHNRRIDAERRRAAQRGASLLKATYKYNFALDVLGSFLAVVAGIMVLFITGLLSGASSTVVQLVLIAAVIYAYVVIFKSAFYS